MPPVMPYYEYPYPGFCFPVKKVIGKTRYSRPPERRMVRVMVFRMPQRVLGDADKRLEKTAGHIVACFGLVVA